MSEGNKSALSEGWNKLLIENTENQFQAFDKLNKRIDKIEDFRRNLQELRDMHNSNLQETRS